MYLAGFSLDNLSLMPDHFHGFVVDDAIVMIENIVRYIEQGIPVAAPSRFRQIGFTVVSLSISLIAVLSRCFSCLVLSDASSGICHHTQLRGCRISSCLTNADADDVLQNAPPGKEGEESAFQRSLEGFFDSCFDRMIAPCSGCSSINAPPSSWLWPLCSDGDSLYRDSQGMLLSGYRTHYRRDDAARIFPSQMVSRQKELSAILAEIPMCCVWRRCRRRSRQSHQNTGRLYIALKARDKRAGVSTIMRVSRPLRSKLPASVSIFTLAGSSN